MLLFFLLEKLSGLVPLIGVIGIGEEWNIVIQVVVFGGVEEGHELVIILVWNRFVGVGVALNAAEGETLHDRPGGVDAVDGGDDSELLVIGAAFGIGLGVAMKG